MDLSVVRSAVRSRWLGFVLLALLHVAALTRMYFTEFEPFSQATFLLVWALFNCFWLVLLRRPVVSAALSLALIEIIVALSQLKFSILWMTINFFDILVIDPDTFAFLLSVFPDLRITLVIVALIAVPVAVMLWRLDKVRVPRWVAAVSGAVSFACIVGLATAKPEEAWEPFQGINHVSGFARSGVLSLSSLMTRGWMESEAEVSERLRTTLGPCEPAGRRPHIIMVLDESSFDISAVPGIKVPAGYADHFQSFDGKTRSLLVEGSGGPTWYTEYNVLTGLSSRSYGRFQYYVTRLAAGRVQRGLPHALRRCGYKTFTLYPAHNAFLSAGRFQAGTGVQRFIDSHQMGMGDVEPDRFFYDQAARLIGRERSSSPMFVFVYTVANHFPWDETYRPDLTPPDWRAPGNARDVDEYIRRQMMSAADYKDFVARLKRDFPDEAFLIVRFGDHQPALAAKIVDPEADDQAIGLRVMGNDPRYYTTYYAVEALNFTPADMASALSPLDAAYLPLIVQEAAGIPLDPSFAEQKKILERCDGLFYLCAAGAEARRFNRLLIDAGLITATVSR